MNVAKFRNRLGRTTARPKRVCVALSQAGSAVESVCSSSRHGEVRVVLSPESSGKLDVGGDAPSGEGISPSEGNESLSGGGTCVGTADNEIEADDEGLAV